MAIVIGLHANVCCPSNTGQVTFMSNLSCCLVKIFVHMTHCVTICIFVTWDFNDPVVPNFWIMTRSKSLLEWSCLVLRFKVILAGTFRWSRWFQRLLKECILYLLRCFLLKMLIADFWCFVHFGIFPILYRSYHPSNKIGLLNISKTFWSKVLALPYRSSKSII